MCIDSIGLHCLIEWYACIPKVHSRAHSKQARVANAPNTDMFLDLVTCRVASNVSICAIKLQPAAAHWILLQGISNRRVRMLPD